MLARVPTQAKSECRRIPVQAVCCRSSTRRAHRIQRGRSAIVAHSAATFYGTFNSPDAAQIAWNTFSFVLAGFAAFYLARPEDESTGSECPRCNGTGREACFCSKWSDGDTAGCASCNYTGHTRCKACGGGGNAVPIALAIRKDEGIPRRPYDQSQALSQSAVVVSQSAVADTPPSV